MLWSFICLWAAIDIGSTYTKTAVTDKNEDVEIMTNQFGKISTPTVIGYRGRPQFDSQNKRDLGQDEAHLIIPEIGDKALKILEVRPTMGAGFFPDLLELNETAKKDRAGQLHTELRGARVSFIDSAALYYKFFLDSTIKKEIKDLTVVVPAHYTPAQRKYAEIIMKTGSDYGVTVIDDIDAAGYVFANDRSNKFAHAPCSVLFIDIGGTSVKAYVVKFNSELTPSGRSTYPLVQKLSYEFDFEIGGQFLTFKIAEIIKGKLKLQNLTAAEERKIINAAERIKIALSADSSADVIVPEIRGRDRNVHLNAEDIDGLLAEFAEGIVRVAKRATENIPFDQVELLGGSSHMRNLVEGVKRGLGVTIIGQNLNCETTLIKGGAYFQQFYHSLSRYPEVKIRAPYSFMNISLMTMNTETRLCIKGAKCVNKATVNGSVQIFVISMEPKHCRPGLKTTGSGYFMDKVDGEVTLSLGEHPYGVYDTEFCNASGCHRVPLQSTFNPEIPSALLDYFTASEEKRIEQRNILRDKLINKTETVLHDVSKDKDFRFFSNHTHRLEIIRVAEGAKKWVEENPNCTSLNEFSSRLSSVDKVSKDVYARVARNSTFVRYINIVYATIVISRDAMKEEWADKTYIPQKTWDRYNELLNETESWLQNIMKTIRSRPPWLDIPIADEELDDRAVELYRLYDVVNRTKRPQKKTGAKVPSKLDPTIMEDVMVDMTDEEIAAKHASEEWKDPFIQENPFGDDADDEIAKVAKRAANRMYKQAHQELLVKKMLELKKQTKKEQENQEL